MKAQIKPDSILLRDKDGVAGVYRLDDPYKPHLQAVYSPAGHNLVLVSPADHRHHKGVQYALRCEDLNFWEEEPGSGHCGRQEILSTRAVENGFEQSLLWREEAGGRHTYEETRTIRVRRLPASGGFLWQWQTRLQALRDHRLIQSPWSIERADGSRVNYHGLGIRLPWVWGFARPEVAGLECDGKPVEAGDLLGQSHPAVTAWGRMDGFQEPPVCALTVSQSGRNPWFVLRQPFPYLACGPTNLQALEVRQGDCFEENYSLLAQDR